MSVKITRAELAEMKLETLGMRWHSRAYPKSQPDWPGIAGDLQTMVHSEETYFAERGRNFTRLAHLHKLLTLATDRAFGR